ncbi:MAG TPA: ABC transporter ATP-binding protein [Clostridiaceae bacterium]|nr:ABC transporter ATP-binding protein [Clostridiaceae bacterium]
MSTIKINNLCKNYGKLQAINNLSLELNSGQIVGLVGPNGSGKSSLLRILGAFDMAYSGEVLINGFKPGLESRKIVSFLPDKPYISENLRAEQIIELYDGFFSDFNKEKAFKMLELFKLKPEQKLIEMSKGMGEKVQVLLTMSRDAEIFILDEPISGVDPASRKIILRSMIEGFSEDALMVVSTHLLNDIENIIDSVIFLDSGQIKIQGSTDDLREQYGKSINELFEQIFQ